MSPTWTNHDRVAFHEFLLTDLGKKFFHYLESKRPESPQVFELNALAFFGAQSKEFDRFLQVIEEMARVPTTPIPPVKFVEVEKD